ncbi:MAG TPA: glutamyl-tRNA reductase [Gemmatimonadaceae bacterium]|nr:glutamyl-tRNA reductase [Gemmatimonadaceae bacterium]
MGLIVAGVSYRTAPLEVRERFAHTASEISESLDRLRLEAGIAEGVLLSTCNRAELYLVEGEQPGPPAVWGLLGDRLGRDAEPYGYVLRDREAATHLFRVASGLDSMILGEAQIHGQVREAWERSRPHAGAILHRLFQTALLVAGRVRSETAIGRGSASISSAAVQLAKQIFGSLRGRHAMVLGAGEMAEVALECLVAEGVRAAIVANRTYERADELARRHGATAMHYDECWSRLDAVDVLLCSTAAPHAVVQAVHVAPSLAGRAGRPLCILDIALPRDVEPSVGALDNVFLYDLDDLRAVAAANLERRRAELPSAEQLIAGEVDKYWEWLGGLAAVPVLTQFRGEMERMRATELAPLLRRLSHLPPGEREAIEHFSRALMNKFLHSPSVRLRAAAVNGRGLGIVDAVRYLFALDDRAADESPSSAVSTDSDQEATP